MSGNWTLCDGSRAGEVNASGSEAAVKEAYRDAIDADPADEGNLYVESPDGDQFAWNKHAHEWDQL